MTATPAWLASIEARLNRGITGSGQASSLAVSLNATAILIDIQGMTAIRAGISGGRMALVAVGPAAAADVGNDSGSCNGGSGGLGGLQADATISGSPLALLQLALGESKGRGPSAVAQVSGNAETAGSYRQLFALARPDFEEELSRFVGDFPARRVSQFAARTLAWVRKARRTAGENLAEYLQEESRDLVGDAELQEFLQGVDTLRDTAERIEARLARLERRPIGSAR